MRYKSCMLYCVWCTICITSAEPTPPNAAYYIGAVVEFPAHATSSQFSSVPERIRQFEQLLDDAVIRPDIVAFPEEVLNDRQQPIILPGPTSAVVPCSAVSDQYDFIISEMSCYARSLSMYILINVMEVQNCTQSNDIVEIRDKCAIYNTNVVFDRRGVLISYYRKYILNGDEWLHLNDSIQPEEKAIFYTDFNVTFGHLTSLDLLYGRSVHALVRRGVTDFLLLSKWQSELPFLTAIQLHQSWAYANNVNLLVAGSNDPINGRSGSGIYAGKYGMLIGSMTSNERQSKLHFSVVPKYGVDSGRALRSFKLKQSLRSELKTSKAITEIPNNGGVLERFTGVQLMRDNDIDFYVTQLLEDDFNASKPLQQQLCHNDLCCDFYIERSINQFAHTTNTSYYYRLAAFHGLGAYLNTAPAAVGVCAIFACTSDHLYTCGRIFDESVEVVPRYSFDFVSVSGNFTRRHASLLTPNSVDHMLMPLAVDAFKWQLKEYSNFTTAIISLVQPRADLLTFGIYGNYFLNELIYEQNKDAAGILSATLWLVLIAFVIVA